MQDYQRDFVHFALGVGALRFGEFVLKSGRLSPYFFNTGMFDSGARLARLGRAYASGILASGILFDGLYGPAYKGIPLVAAVAIALAEAHGRDVPYSFNRKEAKDHAEGGIIVGAPLAGRILIVDDVISAGTSVRESIQVIESAGAAPAGVAIALDRQERGSGDLSAVQEVETRYALPVASIIGLEHLIRYLEERPDSADTLARVRTYQQEYGSRAGARAPVPDPG